MVLNRVGIGISSKWLPCGVLILNHLVQVHTQQAAIYGPWTSEARPDRRFVGHTVLIESGYRPVKGVTAGLY